MFEGYYSPPFYTDLYNFEDGAQNDIFLDSYRSIPTPSPNSTIVPTPSVQPTGVSSSSDPSQTPSSVSPSASANSSIPITGKPQQWYVVSLCLACVHSPRFAVFSSCKITSSSIDVLYSRGSPFSLEARILCTPSAFGTHSELCFPCTCVLYSAPYFVAVTALNLSRSFCPASDRGSRPLHASVVWQCLLLARVTPPRL